MQVVCYGVVPIILQGDERKYLLLKHRNGGFWGFPKGHAQENESAQEVAERELFEETHLHISKLLSHDPVVSRYRYNDQNQSFQKTVYYYLCQVSGSIRIDHQEIIDYKLCSQQEALERISYEEGKRLFLEIIKRIQALE